MLLEQSPQEFQSEEQIDLFVDSKLLVEFETVKELDLEELDPEELPAGKDN
jgi:hypothetical protein